MPGTNAHGRRERLGIYGTALLLTLAGFLVAYQFVEPAPPRTLTLATGAAGGAYDMFGQRYRAFMAQHGVGVTLRNSAGSVENLALLRRGEVDAALVQGGLIDPARDAGLASLGSLFLEPLWIFYREGVVLDDLRDLAGKRVAIGPDGSGTQAVARLLLERNGVDAAHAEFVTFGSGEAIEGLRSGQVDAAIFVASLHSPQVAQLLADPSLRLLHFARAEAYARLFAFLSRVVLPTGFVDLARNRPARPRCWPSAMPSTRHSVTCCCRRSTRSTRRATRSARPGISPRPTRRNCRCARRRHATTLPDRRSCSVSSRSGPPRSSTA
jgi:TRAP transporter TAXI family solute receptor